MVRDLTEGFIRVGLFPGPSGDLNYERLNADAMRLQAQLNVLLERLGGADLLAPPKERGPRGIESPVGAGQLLNGQYISTVTDTGGWSESHTLNRLPDYFMLVQADARIDSIWAGASPWTATRVYFEASGSGVNVVLYVW